MKIAPVGATEGAATDEDDEDEDEDDDDEEEDPECAEAAFSEEAVAT